LKSQWKLILQFTFSSSSASFVSDLLILNIKSIESEKIFKDFKNAGINRISLGIQTLSTRTLKILGREHTAEDSLRSLEFAKKVFPGQISIDMIWGLPDQSLIDWENDLSKILTQADNHLSAYQLVIEQGTKMQKYYESGAYSFPDGDLSANFYEKTVEIAKRFGFNQYEVSSFARHRQESEHNKGYWTGRDYLGIGPGAHARYYTKNNTRERTIQHLQPETWLKEVLENRGGTKKRTQLNQQEILMELVILGMRMKKGISRENFELISRGIPIEQALNLGEVQALQNDGFLELDEEGLRTTKKGFCVMDSILPRILK